MNKSILTKSSVLISIIVLSLFSIDDLKSQTDFGQSVFKKIKFINSVNKSEYLSEFGSIYELKSVFDENEDYDFLTRTNVSKYINRINNTDSKEYDFLNIKDYINLKKWGAKNSIIWRDIEYIDFVEYYLESSDVSYVEDGSIYGLIKQGFGVATSDKYGKVIIVGGELYFKYNKKVYKIDCSAVFNGKEYIYTKISK